MDSLIIALRKVISLVVIGIVALLVCDSSFAQGNLGRITGAVVDQSGGAIAGSTVTVTDVQRGISRTLVTDEVGEYVAPNLQPGTYTVRSEAKGFKTTERSGLVLQVGQDMRIDLTLQPGEQTQTITVTEQAPLVETTNATLGGTLDNETINELPLNGRNYQNLVGLRPGSSFYPGGGGWTQSTNGSRPEDNGYIVDGLTNDHPLTGLTIINGAGVEGDAATILPIDAIQEFKVLENPPAEYGWKPGAIVNVGLKSGTNNIHGTAYAFGRSDAFDARNYFNTVPSGGNCLINGPQPLAACNKTPIELEQFGATVGGPIRKDKIFYFLGFEDERYTLGNLNVDNVPEGNPQATPDIAHSLPDALRDMVDNNGASLGNGISPLSLHLAGCPTTLPTTPAGWSAYTCTGGLYPTNTGTSVNLPIIFPSTFGSDNGLAKIDYHINDHHTLNAMYFISRGHITAPDPGFPFSELQPYWNTYQNNEPQVFGTDWTWIPNSRLVNEARFGVIYMNRATSSLDGTKPATSYGINTGASQLGFPNLIVAGFNSLGNFAAWPITFGPTTVLQAVDNVSYLRGKHTFKFGGEIHHNGVTEGRFSRGRGIIAFLPPGPPFPGSTPLERFLSGVPSRAFVLLGTKTLHLTTWQAAGFAEDDWRIKPRLTLNLGVRYEYLTPLSEQNNLLGNFDPSVGLVQVGKQISSVYKGDHKDFAPRLGMAWDVTGKGTTVVRAGYSIVYDSGLPMFVFVGNGGEQNNSATIGLGAIPTGANTVTCPAANIVGGACNIVPSATPGTGTIQYSVFTTQGPPLVGAWQSQPGDGTGTPIFPSVPRCGDGMDTTGPPDPGPCDILAMDRNFRTPFVSNWTLGVQHSFTDNLALDVAYVGNHGSRLPGITDINQPDLTTGVKPFATQFPYLGYINWLSNLYTSNYNGLQATLTQRASHGLSFVAGYTYSHATDNSSFNINIPLPQDSTKPKLDYDSSIFDIRHRFTFSLTYDLPGIESPGQLLKGWELNSIVTFQTGAPWGAADLNNGISGTNEFTDRWDFSGNPGEFKSGNSSIPFCTGGGLGGCIQNTPSGSVMLSATQSNAFFGACQAAAMKVDGGVNNGPTTSSLNTFGCFAQGNSVMIPPAAGTFGTMSRNPFRDSGFRDWDLSFTKGWKFKERLTAQFRAELFNVLNHPNFANPYGGSNGFGHNDPSSPGTFGCGCATPDAAAGNPVLGTGGNRAIQLGLKLLF
ncbi:MAG TPA: TonB-dependent receptor [Verrucomicrobiae bacterium]|nr:TonB-dependent receptor [Verrucomicrobiae bacterium]